jgi:hypothetical protein
MKLVRSSWILAFILFALPLLAQNSGVKLLGDFEKGWEKHWMERKLAPRPTQFTVVEMDDNQVLQAESHQAASGIWRMLEIHPGKTGKLSWRWKIDNNLSLKGTEKNKLYDDYAARVFVVFEPHFLSWKTKALCYVWASKENVGSMYRSPYAESVGTIVLQSGSANKGKWMTEQRDVIADYQRVFGQAPEMITGVAIMVDTDNSGELALSWFDDLILDVGASTVKPDSARSTN